MAPLKLKIRHVAIVEYIVTNLCAKFNNNRLRNEKALVLTTSTKTRTTFVALEDPFPGPTMISTVMRRLLSYCYIQLNLVIDIFARYTGWAKKSKPT